MIKLKQDFIGTLVVSERPLNIKEFTESYKITEKLYKKYIEFVKSLENKGIINITGGLVKLSLEDRFVIGVFRGHEKGFGFLIPFKEGSHYYVYPKNKRDAIDGDIILAKINRQGKEGKLPEVRVKEVLISGRDKYLGVFYDNGSNGYVILDNPRILNRVYVSKKRRKDAKHLDKVFVKIHMRKSKNKEMSGEIVENLGHKDSVGMDILTLVKNLEIPTEFPEEVIEEVKYVPKNVLEEDLSGRVDLRGGNLSSR